MHRKSLGLVGALLLLATICFGGDAGARPDEWLGGVPEPTATFQELPICYHVAPGDTLWAIAQRYGTSLELIAAANNIALEDFLYPGQLLVIPAGSLVHHVLPGDTLWAISCLYGVSLAKISEVNGLDPDAPLLAGQTLLIPISLAVQEEEADCPKESLSWPVLGLVSSPFGLREGRLHEGIDIAAARGTPVRAAASGRVTYAGPAGTYGLLVILAHERGWATYYAHCSEIYVTPGQQVGAGEVIAAVGDTGRATGPHLHFEVRENGVPYDPAVFLP